MSSATLAFIFWLYCFTVLPPNYITIMLRSNIYWFPFCVFGNLFFWCWVQNDSFQYGKVMVVSLLARFRWTRHHLPISQSGAICSDPNWHSYPNRLICITFAQMHTLSPIVSTSIAPPPPPLKCDTFSSDSY